MSIYIKGDAFYKPTACVPCKIRNWCQLWRQVDLPAHIVHPECPISEVPEHGDLIDRDALPENRMVFNGVKFINERFIKEASVVIPSDKERKG